MKTLLLAAALLLSGLAYGQTRVLTTYHLGGESENALAEEVLFPGLSTQRQLAGRLAHTGQAVVQLTAHPRPTSLTSVWLPVRAGQQLTLEGYAYYLLPGSHPWPKHLAAAIASGLVIGTTPRPLVPAGEYSSVPSHHEAPYIGLGATLPLTRLFHNSHSVLPQAYVQYKLYDHAGASVGSGRQAVSQAARTGWEPVQLRVTIPVDGFVEVVLGSDAGIVYFDDLQAILREAPASMLAIPREIISQKHLSINTTVSALLIEGAQIKDGYLVQRVKRPISSPTKEAGASKGYLPKVGATPNLRATCTEIVDVYYNMNTGEIIGEDVVSVDCGSGGAGGDGGSGSGGGSGGHGTPPNPHPILTVPKLITGECAGLTEALALQAANHKEVAGFYTSNGTVILLPMNDIRTTDSHFGITFPIYDSNNKLITNGPFQENGVWKIEMNDWTSGHTVTSYNLLYFFHTHPTGIAPDGTTYDSDHPSADDKANVYPGLGASIINANNLISYNATGIISSVPNTCH